MRVEKGPLLVFVGSALFGTSGLIQALAPHGATPYVIGAVQSLVSGISLLLWLTLRRELESLRDWNIGKLILSILTIAGFQVFFYLSMAKAGVAAGSVVAIGTTPLAAAVFAWLLLRQRPTRRWYAATPVAIAGVVLLNFGMDFSADPFALAYPLATGLCYGLFLVISPQVSPRPHPVQLTMLVSLGAALLLSPCLFIWPVAWLLSGHGVLTALALGILASSLPFSLLLAGMAITPASTGATLTLAEPLTGALIGILILGEPFGAAVAAGIGLIAAAALYLATEPAN